MRVGRLTAPGMPVVRLVKEISWRRSVLNGLKYVVVWAPTRLCALTAPPVFLALKTAIAFVFTAAISVVWFLFAVVFFIADSILVLVAAFLGLVSFETSPAVASQKPTDTQPGV